MLRIWRSSIQLAMFDLEIEAVVGRGEGKGKRVADLLNGSPVCLPFCTL